MPAQHQQLQNGSNNRCCSQQHSLLMNLTTQQPQQAQQQQQQQQGDSSNLSQSEWVNLMTSMNLGHLYETQFQYVLGAATTPASKLNEETLTYLNQGQSYELKLKRLGELISSDSQSQPQHLLKSMVRVVFHERRLQYNEKEKLNSWRQTRPGERILDIDIPLSYGLLDVKIDPQQLSCLEFVWDPRRDCAVFIKINCISTEFTPKRHGGEKGVPFRIQVETYSLGTPAESRIIHCASCQVKVFKPKGADRKHKTDKEKLEKKSDAEREKYQPSYEYTFLNEIPLEQVKNYLEQINEKPAPAITAAVLSGVHDEVTMLPLGGGMISPQCLVKPGGSPVPGRMLAHPSGQAYDSTAAPNSAYSSDGSLSWSVSPLSRPWTNSADQSDETFMSGRTDMSQGLTSSSPQEIKRVFYTQNQQSPVSNSRIVCNDINQNILSPQKKPTPPSELKLHDDSLNEDFMLDVTNTADEVMRWLHAQRFSKYIDTFYNFSGSDLLRLTRDDLIQICGLADGIRLNNALHSKKVRPKLTLYMFQDPVACVRDRLKRGTSGNRWGSNWELSSSTPPSASVITSTSPSMSPHHSTLSPKPTISSTLDSPLQIRKKLGEFQGGEPMSPKRRSPGYDSSADDLFNSSPKKLRTRALTLASDESCYAVYLERCTLSQLTERLAELYGISAKSIGDVVCRRVEGGATVNIVVTDSVVENLPDQSKYGIDAVADDDNSSLYHIHMRAVGNESD